MRPREVCRSRTTQGKKKARHDEARRRCARVVQLRKRRQSASEAMGRCAQVVQLGKRRRPAMARPKEAMPKSRTQEKKETCP
ncbi:hypothetical protein GW17_00057872 [Ensete ventricosum]|nr:hypothetical protein GW17_00057872 [Ensete ventricosum]